MRVIICETCGFEAVPIAEGKTDGHPKGYHCEYCHSYHWPNKCEGDNCSICKEIIYLRNKDAH